jgi:hypothetical protein
MEGYTRKSLKEPLKIRKNWIRGSSNYKIYETTISKRETDVRDDIFTVEEAKKEILNI